MNNQEQLPAYRSIKQVRAGMIIDIEPVDGAPEIFNIWVVDGTLDEFTTADHVCFTVESSFINKHMPQGLGYLVIYPDNYMSYCPAEAFLKGNIPLK